MLVKAQRIDVILNLTSEYIKIDDIPAVVLVLCQSSRAAR